MHLKSGNGKSMHTWRDAAVMAIFKQQIQKK
jgi:hypothetical protein